MKTKSAVCVIVSALAIIPNLAEADDLKHYVQLNAGYAYGLAPKGDFEKGKMGKSGMYGAEFGYKINDHFRTSLSIDYRDRFSNGYSVAETKSLEMVDEDDGSLSNITLENNKTSRIKANSLAIMANIYYDIASLSRFTPYLMVGMGAAINKTSQHISTVEVKTVNSAKSIDAKGTRRSFAYKVGAGTRISLSERFEIDLRYQFADLGKFQTGNNHESYSDGELIEKTKSPKVRGMLRSHEVLVGISYKF